MDGIKIEELREAGEDGGSLMGFYAKGSIDRSDFADACNAHTGADSSYDRRYVRADQCRHEWWRCIPISGEPGCYRFIAATPGSNGAFPATVWDNLYQRITRDAQNHIDAVQLGIKRGQADGVRWAIFLLENSHPEAANKLLDAWRNTPPKAEV